MKEFLICTDPCDFWMFMQNHSGKVFNTAKFSDDGQSFDEFLSRVQNAITSLGAEDSIYTVVGDSDTGEKELFLIYV